MPDRESNSLEYLSMAFKGLSAEKKDYVLDIAQSLLKVQDDKNYLVNSKTVPHLETQSADATKKI
jgi:hypothetical protein